MLPKQPRDSTYSHPQPSPKPGAAPAPCSHWGKVGSGHASSSSSAQLSPEPRVAAAFATAETRIPVYDHGSHANSFWKRPSWGFKTYLKKASSARARRQVTTRQLPHINIIKKLRASVCMAAYFRQPK